MCHIKKERLLLSQLLLIEPVIQIVGKRRALLKEDYDVGPFTIPSGFQFDGASMPSWTWSLLGLDPFGRICAAALPHDLLYVNCGRVLGPDGAWMYYTERQADDMFGERCSLCEMSWLQYRLVRRAVILFGDYDTYHKSKSATWNKEWLKAYNQFKKHNLERGINKC